MHKPPCVGDGYVYSNTLRHGDVARGVTYRAKHLDAWVGPNNNDRAEK
ncbi:MAG: hypothetical protein HOI95_30420 [Chromatiales bacterium]|nr:hypothetical protein [Chromatiales bacterium]